MNNEKLPPLVEFILQEEEPAAPAPEAKDKPAPATMAEASPAADESAPDVTDDESTAVDDEPAPDVTDEPTEASADTVAVALDGGSWDALETLGYSAEELDIDELCDPDLWELDAQFVSEQPTT